MRSRAARRLTLPRCACYRPLSLPPDEAAGRCTVTPAAYPTQAACPARPLWPAGRAGALGRPSAQAGRVLRGGPLEAETQPPMLHLVNGRLRLEATGATHVGLRRSRNEDSLGLLPTAYDEL